MSFSIDLSRFSAKAGKNAGLVVRKVCLDLTASVVLKTPVDTGRARANWQGTIGAPASGTVDYTGDAGTEVQAPSPSGGSAKAIQDAQDAAFKAAGNVFFLTNNLPYIEALEYLGHSKQAPSGMARISILEIKNALKL